MAAGEEESHNWAGPVLAAVLCANVMKVVLTCGMPHMLSIYTKENNVGNSYACIINNWDLQVHYTAVFRQYFCFTSGLSLLHVHAVCANLIF